MMMNYESRIKQLESELKILKEEKETYELEIRHLKLVNSSSSHTHSQRSLNSNQMPSASSFKSIQLIEK